MVRPSLSLSPCGSAMDYSPMIWLNVGTAHVLLSISIINNVSFCCCCCFTVMLGGFAVTRRIQSQYDHLEQEYRQTCIGALRSNNTRGCGKVI